MPTKTETQPVSPETALDAAIKAAFMAAPVVMSTDHADQVMVPEGFELKKVKHDYALPPRIEASVVVDDRASLSAYANRYSGPSSILLADYDRLDIAAVLDWHGSNEAELHPSACTHKAALKLRSSEEFSRWNAFEGELHRQDEFAAFLEENVSDVCNPEPSVLLEISRDLEATQDVNFKASTRLESGDRAFVYESDTHVKGDVKVPREFWLSIPLFQGEAEIEIRAALRFKVTPSGLLLGFEWRRVEYQRQAHFREIATTAAEETGLPVFFGRT